MLALGLTLSTLCPILTRIHTFLKSLGVHGEKEDGDERTAARRNCLVCRSEVDTAGAIGLAPEGGCTEMQDECSEFAELARQRAKKHAIREEPSQLNPLGTVLNQDVVAQRAIDAFNANDDPLFRAGLYQRFLLMGLADKDEIIKGLDHALILSVKNHTSKPRLAQVIQEVENLRSQTPPDIFWKSEFKLRRHALQKAVVLSGFDAERLLPKLRKLSQSSLW